MEQLGIHMFLTVHLYLSQHKKSTTLKNFSLPLCLHICRYMWCTHAIISSHRNTLLWSPLLASSFPHFLGTIWKQNSCKSCPFFLFDSSSLILQLGFHTCYNTRGILANIVSDFYSPRSRSHFSLIFLNKSPAFDS